MRLTHKGVEVYAGEGHLFRTGASGCLLYSGDKSDYKGSALHSFGLLHQGTVRSSGYVRCSR